MTPPPPSREAAPAAPWTQDKAVEMLAVLLSCDTYAEGMNVLALVCKAFIETRGLYAS
jgi:hypothetical protein